MSKWQKSTLGEKASVQTGPFGSQLKNEQYVTGGTPVVTVEHVKDFLIEDFVYPSVTDVDRTRLKKYILKAGDIVFSRVGSVDLSALVKEHQDGWLFSSRMLRVRVQTELDADFLSYYLRQSTIRQFIISIAVGSTMPSINTEILKSLPIVYCPLEEQKEIARVLSCLDRKISNLRKQNETLEKIAQTLFKHWFINFEFPNEDGKPYKLSGGKMEPSELGEIPAGWRVGKLGNVADVTSSKRIFRSEYVESGIPFYRSKEIIELSSGQGISTPLYISPERFVEIKEKFGAPEAGEVLVTSVGTIGVIYIVTPEDKFYFKDGNLTWIKNFRDGFNGVFIYFWLKSDATKIQIEKNTIGSTQRALTIQALGGLKLIIPLPQVLSDYRDFVGSVHNKKEINTQQIRTLTQTRDVLLPKLMSGKLRIQES